MIFSNFFYIIILIIIIKLSISSIDSSIIFPVNKILLAQDVNEMASPNRIKNDLNSIGFGITFNDSLNISLIPINLFKEIELFFKGFEDIIVRIVKYENGNKEIILFANLYYGLETIHFIFENFGISIPLKYFLIEKDEVQKYGIRFQTNEKQEFITFGKDLIDIMGIELNGQNNLVIKNEEFLTKFIE